MKYFETDRLVFRTWKESDTDHFIAMNQDPEVMRYFPNTLTKEATLDFIKRIKTEFLASNYGLYAVEEKLSGEFIGFIGFHQATFQSDFTPCVEIGWRLKKEAWGKGYGTEGAKACLAYGFEVLGLEEVYSFTAKINQPSSNVMEKIGMDYVKSFDHPAVDEDSILKEHVLYKIISDTVHIKCT